MNTAASDEARIVILEVTDEFISARLADGRIISVPLTWSWRLAEATPAQRRRFEILGSGEGVHWPEVDEDIAPGECCKGHRRPHRHEQSRSGGAPEIDQQGYPMNPDFKRLTDFLVGLEIEKVPHTEKTYLAHLTSVYRYMERCGCNAELCRAGMFHSIYGTELFQGFKLPLERRPSMQELIGDRAERLAYLNCAMDRASLDRAVETGTEPYRIVDRVTGTEVNLSEADFDDLCRIHLYDFLEQVPRSKWWDYRRAGYRAMAHRLGGRALEEYDRVFSQETSEKADAKVWQRA